MSGDRRTEVVSVRLTATEAAALRRIAGDMSLSDLIRRLIAPSLSEPFTGTVTYNDNPVSVTITRGHLTSAA